MSTEDPYREVGMDHDFLRVSTKYDTEQDLEQRYAECIALKARVAELLAACKALVESGRTPRDTEEFRAAVAAITKAEGRDV